MPEQTQLTYPLDHITQKTIFQTINKTFTVLLPAQETAKSDEGTHTFLNFTPCVQMADSTTGTSLYSLVPHQNIILSSIKFWWSTPATSGNLAWQIDIGEGGISEQNNARITGNVLVETAADGVANDLKLTDIYNSTAVTNTEFFQAGHLWGIMFTRLAASSEDTLSNTMNIYGIQLEYQLYAI